ncbi:serine/threonine-protein kinase [Granulicoccus phenolivorans]|uniref:serine/threonine-protein kinase n=1 Tax=Granulicoccus phenolivorans TaxID=266854 RepID=UPI0003FAA687|nr:serine/threonine-protein kinase [Granulicoccus phenolivorans]
MEKIGRYRLTRRLGSGSFATVWLGHDDDLDVPVAVKVLAENWADNDDVRGRFLGEAKLMRRIHDERLVRVYDIGSLADTRPYFVMDYCNGGSLNDLRQFPRSLPETLRLCAEGCRALHTLHTNGVIHRDVTPGNLLLHIEQSGITRVKVADLGVAKQMMDQAGATMTAGTPAYMAPEQAMGEKLDPRADIYAMGCVMYAVLTGRPPFQIRNLTDLLRRNPQDRPEPLPARLNAPPALEGLMTAAVSHDPARRPPTALAMAEAIERILDHQPDPADVPTTHRNRIPPVASSAPSAPSAPSVPPAASLPSAPSMPPSAEANPFAAPGTPQSYGAATGSPFAQQQVQPFVGFTPTMTPRSVIEPQPESDQRTSGVFWALMGLIAILVFAAALLITLAIVG